MRYGLSRQRGLVPPRRSFQGNCPRRRQAVRTKHRSWEVGEPPAGATPFTTALWLLSQGLWPVPISAADDLRSPSPGKAPIGRGWGLRRPTPRGLRAVYSRHPGAGVGIRLGPEAGVIDVEVDDPVRAGPVLERIFPHGLPPTAGWLSARGEHRLYAWDDRITNAVTSSVASLAGGGLELRLGGAGKQLVAVCPPSPSTDGRPRLWNGVWEVAPFPEPLLRELRRLRRRQKKRACPHSLDCNLPRPGGGYGESALRREAALVRSAEPGTRNQTLNRAAFNLGQLIPAGILSRATVEDVLTGAALASGLPLREVRATLRSGLEAGLLCPRPAARVRP